MLEELAGELGEAARRHPERRAGLALVFATRVWGYAPEELARAGGEDVRAVRARRARAERALVAGAERAPVAGAERAPVADAERARRARAERALVAGAGTGRTRWA